MNDATSRINDPAMREQIKTRYEAGEHVALCTELDIDLSILSRWARVFGWPPSWASGRPRHEQVAILIQQGYTNATIARVVAISAETVRTIRHKITTDQIPPPAQGMDGDRVPLGRPPGHWAGWYCGSCSWWGETGDEYIFHKKKHEREP